MLLPMVLMNFLPFPFELFSSETSLLSSECLTRGFYVTNLVLFTSRTECAVHSCQIRILALINTFPYCNCILNGLIAVQFESGFLFLQL